MVCSHLLAAPGARRSDGRRQKQCPCASVLGAITALGCRPALPFLLRSVGRALPALARVPKKSRTIGCRTNTCAEFHRRTCQGGRAKPVSSGCTRRPAPWSRLGSRLRGGGHRVLVVWLAGMVSSALVVVQPVSLILLQSVQVNLCATSAPDHRADGRVLVVRRWCGPLVRRSGLRPSFSRGRPQSRPVSDVDAEI